MFKGHLVAVISTALLFSAACSDDTVVDQKDLGVDIGGDIAVVDGPGMEATVPPVEAGLDLAGDTNQDIGNKEAGQDIGGSEAGQDIGGSEAGPDIGQDMTPDITMGDLGPCSLKIASVNGTAVTGATQFSSLDDQDTSKSGIQISVVVSAVNIGAGAIIELGVTNVAIPYMAPASGGAATFSGVTVASSLSSVVFSAASGSCINDVLSFSVLPDPTCTVTTPANGTTLYSKDNTNASSGKFTYGVAVSTTGATGGTVGLEVNSAAASPTASQSAAATVTFKDTELKSTSGAKETNTIKATVSVPVGSKSLTATCNNTATVDLSSVTCKLDASSFSPAPVVITGAPGYALNSTKNTVTVTTDTSVNQVTLAVGSTNLLATPAAGKATFNATLPTGTVTLQATCTNTTTGATNKSASFSVLVATGAPKAIKDLACSITKRRGGKITCTWKTDGPFVSKYALHYNPDTALSAANFASAKYKKLGKAAAHGKTNSIVSFKLPLGSTYYVAVKQMDATNQASTISNLPAGLKLDYLKVSVTGSSAKGRLGQTMASGDFNCDGYSDLAVSEIGYSTEKGRVRIYWGSATGLGTASFTNIIGSQAVGKFGFYLTALNFDGDSAKCDDLAVQQFASDVNRGRVYLYLGKKTWTGRTDLGTGNGAEVMYRIPKAAANTTYRLGWGLTSADVNGDGRGDLAFGYFNKKTGGSAELLVIYGKKGIPLMAAGKKPIDMKMPGGADLRIQGGSQDGGFGQLNAGGGRLNGDIYHDLLVGASLESPPTYNGAVYVIKGAAGTSGIQTKINIKTSNRVVRIAGASTSLGFGLNVGGVGDLNGDGKAEFAVSEPFSGTGNPGKVYVFSLNGSTTPKTSADAVIVVNNDNTYFKSNLTGRGLANAATVHPIKGADLNLDGRADLLFSGFNSNVSGARWGQIYVFNGKSGAYTTLKTWKLSAANYLLADDKDRSAGWAEIDIFVKDVNGDGFVDFAVGDSVYKPYTGRFELYY